MAGAGKNTDPEINGKQCQSTVEWSSCVCTGCNCPQTAKVDMEHTMVAEASGMKSEKAAAKCREW